MTPRDGQAVLAQGLAFKAYEIEELVDVYFFRRLGFVVARVAAALRLTPTQVTVFGALVGVAGGAMLYDQRLGLYAFALLILHGIIDSADGQLARMTGQVDGIGPGSRRRRRLSHARGDLPRDRRGRHASRRQQCPSLSGWCWPG